MPRAPFMPTVRFSACTALRAPKWRRSCRGAKDWFSKKILSIGRLCWFHRPEASMFSFRKDGDMRIDNPKLLAEFRKKARCEWCGVRSDTGRDPAHIIGRGAGGPDIRCNLVSLCRQCHTESHTGGYPSYFDMLAVVSRREKAECETIEDVVNL